MFYQVYRQFENQSIRIPMRTWGDVRCIVKASHPTKPNTKYFDTDAVINGFDKFTIKIPKMPSSVIIELYNENNGQMDNDSTIAVGNITSEPIRLGWRVDTILNKTVSSFAKFSDDFAENAGILAAQNSVHLSDDGRFRIDYKDIIRDDDGTKLTTPARINSRTKIIEISKKHYVNFTVPGRKAINWHEFSHMFINKDKSNEFEADKNAVMIYLGMGNPVIEAYNVFLNVFQNTPTALNAARYNELNSFIRSFSKKINQKVPVMANA